MSSRKAPPGLKTLLQDFIRKRYKAYTSPKRKGTKKGEAIGFSRSKYHATLYFLFDTKRPENKLIYLAKLVGESHNLIRKWHIEESFLKQIEIS